MKEKILKAFSDLGFKLEELEGVGYGFTYEGLTLLYMYNESDEDFLNISLPCIIEAEEGKMLEICALMEKINSTLKYVKAYIFSGGVWLVYERELLGEADLTTVISHMVLHLEAGFSFARKTLDEIEEAVENGASGDDGVEASEEAVAEETVDNDKNE